jgi:hypothetical protein
MGKLDDIRQSLLAGNSPKQLIDEGYAKSSVFNEAKKLKNAKSTLPSMPVSDELQELRQKRDMIKLQKEIADIEADKDKLPERISTLEIRVMKLESVLSNAVDTALCISLKEAGWNHEEAEDYADGWVGRNIKGEPR